MKAKRILVLLALILGLLLLNALLPFVHPTLAGQLTIPTRTPTPEPGGGGPTDTPSEPGPAPQPTATRRARATATATVVVLPPTADGGLAVTAQACAEPPTVFAATGPVNLRGGPGTGYETVGELQFQEARRIIGRAANTAWWLIALDAGNAAWVADRVVEVSGYIGRVPLVDPPPLAGGNTPTPESPWEPTPDPGCPPPPTETATATASPSPSLTATATATTTPSSTPTPARSDELAEAATSGPPAITPDPVQVEDVELAQEDVPPAAPLPEEDAGGMSLVWLPIAGLALIGAAAFLTIRGREH